MRRTIHGRNTMSLWRRPLSAALSLALLSVPIAACGADRNAAVEPTAAAVMPTDGPDQGVTSGTPIPGQGGLTDDPEADQPVVTTPQAGAAGQGDNPLTVTLSDIDENPDAFAGQRVTIEGTLAEVFGPRSFAIGDVAAGVGPLLVVGSAPGVFPEELTAAANPNLMVAVTGDVRSFNLPAFEADLNADFPDERLAAYEGRTTIVADLVEVIDEEQAGAGAVAQDNVVGIGDIADDTEQYLGQRVTLSGEVAEAYGENAFRLGEGNVLDIGDEILVVLAGDAQRPQTLVDETDVQLTGEVRRFERAGFEQEFGLSFEDEALWDEFEGQAVVVASDVRPRATVSEIDDDRDAYLGNRVTVFGDITEMLDERVYRLDDPALLGGDDVLLFLSSADLPAEVGQRVYATGTVREFNTAELGPEYGYQWDENLLGEFANDTVLVAEAIVVHGQIERPDGFTGDLFGDPENAVGIGDIDADPQQFVGQQVTLGGEVSETLGGNLLRIDEDNLLDIGDEILVLLGSDVQRPQTLTDETDIQVTGEVRLFERAAFEQEFGLVNLGDELFTEIEGQPVVVARNLFLMPTLSELDDNAEAYLGNQLTIFGVVGEQVGPRSFRLNDPQAFGGDDVLVIARDPAATITSAQELYVTGTVREFGLAEVEQELGFDLQDDMFADWGGRTVILADTLTPAAQ